MNCQMNWFKLLKQSAILNYQTPYQLKQIPFKVGNAVTLKGGYYNGAKGIVMRAEPAKYGFKLLLHASRKLPGQDQSSQFLDQTFVYFTDPRDEVR